MSRRGILKFSFITDRPNLPRPRAPNEIKSRRKLVHKGVLLFASLEPVIVDVVIFFCTAHFRATRTAIIRKLSHKNAVANSINATTVYSSMDWLMRELVLPHSFRVYNYIGPRSSTTSSTVAKRKDAKVHWLLPPHGGAQLNFGDPLFGDFW